MTTTKKTTTKKAAEKPKNITAKLAEIMRDVHLMKDGQAKMGGGGFKYFSHEQVSRAISAMLSERGIMFHPSMEELVPSGQVVIIKFLMRFVDSETGETVESTWFGEGKNGMGAINSAASFAVKYFLLKFFLIGESEDLDAVVDSGEKIDRGDGVRAFVAMHGGDFDALPPDRQEKALAAFKKQTNGTNGARRF